MRDATDPPDPDRGEDPPAAPEHRVTAGPELVRGAPMVDMGFGTSGPGEEAEVLDPEIMLVPLAATMLARGVWTR